MVLAVLVAFGAVVGASEGIQASQRRARREEHRSRKNNLVVHCPKSSAFARLLEGRRVVLSGGCLYVDTNDSANPDAPFGHPFAGYFLPYPDARYAGLVSTITDVAPIMNWVFVDRVSYSLCYGARATAEGQYTGPWDCTRQDRRLTFGGWEGFVAVRQPPEIGGGFWQLFFDRDADRLQARLATMPKGTVVVEVELARRELRTPAPAPPEPVGEGEGDRESTKEKEAGEQRDGEKEEEKAVEKEGQLTAEQVAELQRRLQAEEEAQKRQLIEAARENTRQGENKKENISVQEKTKLARKHSRGSTRLVTPKTAMEKGAVDTTTTAAPTDTNETTAVTDTTSTRSRRSQRSNRSRRSNKSVKSTNSTASNQSDQSSAQHSIRTTGTSTTKSTTTTSTSTAAADRASSRNSNISSNSSRRKDTDTDEDGSYSSSVYSGYFDSSGYPTTPDENENLK